MKKLFLLMLLMLVCGSLYAKVVIEVSTSTQTTSTTIYYCDWCGEEIESVVRKVLHIPFDENKRHCAFGKWWHAECLEQYENKMFEFFKKGCNQDLWEKQLEINKLGSQSQGGFLKENRSITFNETKEEKE